MKHVALMITLLLFTGCGGETGNPKSKTSSAIKKNMTDVQLVKILLDEVNKSGDSIAINYAESLSKQIQGEKKNSIIVSDLTEMGQHAKGGLKSAEAKSAYEALCEKYGVK